MPLKVKLPSASAITVAPPVSVSVAPSPIDAGTIDPLMVTGCASIVVAVASPPLTVIGWLDGVKDTPLFDTVTVKAPSSTLVKR
jgi:hypothetical protein